MRVGSHLLPWLCGGLLLAACSSSQPELVDDPALEDADFSQFDDSDLYEDAPFIDEEEVPTLPEDETLLSKILRTHPELYDIDELYRSGGEHYFAGRLDLAEEHFFLLKERLEVGVEAPTDSLGLLYLSSMEKKVEKFAEILAEERFFSESYAPTTQTLSEAYQSLRSEYGIPESLLPTPEETSSQFELELLLVQHEKVDKWMEYFTGRGRTNYQTWLDRKAQIGHILEGILVEEGLPAELVYLSMIESGLSARARSRAAAVGYWQFVSGTARNRGLVVNDWLDERRDIERSTQAAARHLKMLYGMFGQWPLALAAYNAGEYRIQRAIGLQGDPSYWELRLPRETREYVPKFIAAARIGADPESFGFAASPPDSLRFDVVELEDAYSLEQLAKSVQIDTREFQDLNPQLLAGCTPPNTSNYAVRVPAGKGEALATAAAEIPEAERLNWRKHRVRNGETLGQLARRYRTSVRSIMDLNGIRDPRRVRAGRVLTIPYPRGYQPPASTSVASSGVEPQPAPAGTKEITYRVRTGDTLDAIARVHGVSVTSIRRANGMRGSRIYAGQQIRLHIPAGQQVAQSSSVSENTHERLEYQVRRGDTLTAIGRRYGVDVGDLLHWNDLPASGRIIPGDVLQIWRPRGGS